MLEPFELVMMAWEYAGDDATWANMSHIQMFFQLGSNKELAKHADARLCRDLTIVLHYATQLLNASTLVTNNDIRLFVAGGAVRRVAHDGRHPNFGAWNDVDLFVMDSKSPMSSLSFVAEDTETQPFKSPVIDLVCNAIAKHNASQSIQWAWSRAPSNKSRCTLESAKFCPPAELSLPTISILHTGHTTAEQLVNASDFAFLRCWWTPPSEQNPTGDVHILDREALRTLTSPYWPHGMQLGAAAQKYPSVRVVRLKKYTQPPFSISLTPEQRREYEHACSL